MVIVIKDDVQYLGNMTGTDSSKLQCCLILEHLNFIMLIHQLGSLGICTAQKDKSKSRIPMKQRYILINQYVLVWCPTC
jgi:hypothetical protein